jgi:hypothetical protein
MRWQGVLYLSLEGARALLLQGKKNIDIIGFHSETRLNWYECVKTPEQEPLVAASAITSTSAGCVNVYFRMYPDRLFAIGRMRKKWGLGLA